VSVSTSAGPSIPLDPSKTKNLLGED